MRNVVVLDKTPENKGPQTKSPQTSAQGADESNLKVDHLEPLLEPLPGHVLPQFTRCGKSNCRCKSGEMHGPYFYRIWRDGKQVRKVYVNPHELEHVRRRTALYEATQNQLKHLVEARHTEEAQLKRQWRQFQKLADQPEASELEASKSAKGGA